MTRSGGLFKLGSRMGASRVHVMFVSNPIERPSKESSPMEDEYVE